MTAIYQGFALTPPGGRIPLHALLLLASSVTYRLGSARPTHTHIHPNHHITDPPARPPAPSNTHRPTPSQPHPSPHPPLPATASPRQPRPRNHNRNCNRTASPPPPPPPPQPQPQPQPQPHRNTACLPLGNDSHKNLAPALHPGLWGGEEGLWTKQDINMHPK